MPEETPRPFGGSALTSTLMKGVYGKGREAGLLQYDVCWRNKIGWQRGDVGDGSWDLENGWVKTVREAISRSSRKSRSALGWGKVSTDWGGSACLARWTVGRLANVQAGRKRWDGGEKCCPLVLVIVIGLGGGTQGNVGGDLR